jgi:hypothetical protein
MLRLEDKATDFRKFCCLTILGLEETKLAWQELGERLCEHFGRKPISLVTVHRVELVRQIVTLRTGFLMMMMMMMMPGLRRPEVERCS